MASSAIPQLRTEPAAQPGLLRRLFARQWSFFWAGVTFGLAQIIYMVTNMIRAAQAGKPLSADPLTVTTGLGAMFRGLEVALIGDSLNLYGQVFKPDVWWPIIGMIVGGFIVGIMEGEFRTFVKYDKKVLLITFFGGAIFSYGTRLAGGCTLNHLLGGLPLANINSTIAVLFMGIGGFSGFWGLSKIKAMTQSFKHQETRAYLEKAAAAGHLDDVATYDKSYRPWADPWRWAGMAFLLALIGVALWGGLTNPDYKSGVISKGWLYVIGTSLAGIIAGIGMAKSGFGTECAVISAEAGGMMAKNESRFRALGMPRITMTMFKGMLPLQGVLAAITITSAFVFLSWILFGAEVGYHGSIKYQLTGGTLIGALLMGFGAVSLIGCEIRSYMRMGLGYVNALVGFMGFALGYLPYTLFPKAHEAFLKSTLMVESYSWYELLFPNNLVAQKIFTLLWVAVLAGLLYFVIKVGASRLAVAPGKVTSLSTEDLHESLGPVTK